MAVRIVAALLLATLCLTAYGQTNPSREETLRAGRTALRQQNFAEAIRLLEDGLKRFPGDRALRVELGRAYLYGGQQDRAIQLFREVLLEEPSNPQAKLELARALGYRRDYEASNQLYRELLAANPDDESASVGLVRNLIHQRRKAEARRELNRALARHPDSKRLQEYSQRLERGEGRRGERQSRVPEPAGRRRSGRLLGSGAYFKDSAGNRSWRFRQQFDYQFSRGLTSRLQVEERSLWKNAGPKANLLWGTDELRLRLSRSLRLGVGAGAVRFADGTSRLLYSAEAELHPARHLWFTAGFSRIPIAPTYRATQFDLLAQGWHTRVDWNPGLWRMNARWSRQHYSDGNRAQRAGAEVVRWVGDSQFALGAGYRYSYVGFSQNLHHGYFSPNRYQSHLGVGGVKFRLGRRFRGEYIARVGGESISKGGPFRAAWELALRNRMQLGNWEIGGDYFYYRLAQTTGAFRAHVPRFVISYYF